MKKIFIPIFIITLLLIPKFARTESIFQNEAGAKANGMGGAFIGLADDYSSIYWNPAGITQLKKITLSAFGPSISYSGSYRYDMATVDTQTGNKAYYNGGFGFSLPLFRKKLVIGMLHYMPTNFEVEWNGNELVNIAENQSCVWNTFFQVKTFSPFIAYKFGRILSLGIALNFNDVSLKIKKASYGQYQEEHSGDYSNATIGLLITPSKKFSFGFSLKTANKTILEGNVEMESVWKFYMQTESESTREIKWPLWAGVGVAFCPDKKWTITADLQYTNWKKLDIIPVEYEDNGWNRRKTDDQAGVVVNQDINLAMKNTLLVRFGAEYRFAKSFALRGGYYYHPSAIPTDYISLNLPSISYNVYTMGLGYASKAFNLDLSLKYMKGRDREVIPMSDNLIKGIYGMNKFVPMLSVMFKL